MTLEKTICTINKIINDLKEIKSDKITLSKDSLTSMLNDVKTILYSRNEAALALVEIKIMMDKK